MGHIDKEDHTLHYTGGAHRWIAPDGIEQSAWDVAVQAHLDDHRTYPVEIVLKSHRDM